MDNRSYCGAMTERGEAGGGHGPPSTLKKKKIKVKKKRKKKEKKKKVVLPISKKFFCLLPFYHRSLQLISSHLEL
jgi:hypothetical protein